MALNSSSSEDGGSVEAEKVSYSVETVEAQVEQTDDEIVAFGNRRLIKSALCSTP